MYMDIHSHTYYSKCGRDDPHAVIDAAIAGGIEVFGLSDHNYGILDRKREYKEMVDSLKKEYAGRIKLLCGIEIATLPEYYDIKDGEIDDYDYCLVEHLDWDGSIMEGDLLSFAKQFKIPCGIAHTDLFAFIGSTGRKPEVYLKELADAGVFWELNVNYDNIHNHHEHDYVTRFLKRSSRERRLVRESGLRLSVGFDGHRVEDYLPERVKAACNEIEAAGIKLVDIEAK